MFHKMMLASTLVISNSISMSVSIQLPKITALFLIKTADSGCLLDKTFPNIEHIGKAFLYHWRLVKWRLSPYISAGSQRVFGNRRPRGAVSEFVPDHRIILDMPHDVQPPSNDMKFKCSNVSVHEINAGYGSCKSMYFLWSVHEGEDNDRLYLLSDLLWVLIRISRGKIRVAGYHLYQTIDTNIGTLDVVVNTSRIASRS